MNWQQIDAIVRTSLGEQIIDDLDWFPEIKAGLAFYCSDICDRVADRLRVAPAALAYRVKSALALSSYDSEVNNRGYILIPVGSEQLKVNGQSSQPKSSLARPSKVIIYIQPPTKADLDLNYLKLFSQFALQILALQEDSDNFCVLVPGTGKAKGCVLSSEVVPSNEQFQTLLEHLKSAAQKPSAQQLSILHDLVGSDSCSHALSINLWLSNDFLGLGGVSDILNSLRTQLLTKGSLNVRSTNIDGQSRSADLEWFQQEYIRQATEGGKGGALFSYLGQLAHAQDLDWNIPVLTNWLNLKMAVGALNRRLGSPEVLPLLTKNWSDGSIEELMFLSNNLDLLYLRLKYKGAVPEALSYLKRYCNLAHFGLNQRLISNNLASIGSNFSSIIG